MSDASNNDSTLLEEARTLPSLGERLAFLKNACQGDEEHFAELKRLLEVYEQADNFFATCREADSMSVAPCTEAPGTRIGRYKILQKIGEGGFGVVYMAEQLEPVVRKVALKIIKPGMDSKQVVARFESERQALALMDHPNIAKVHDGGTTEQGRPYFVMELVSGIPITQFCDEGRYTTEQRLKTFQDVCSAIQHAHQKGIIHRDIKPSNILVTLHGDQAVPKVIDFGIAKATQQRLTDKTLFTQFQQFMGTPAYMSPEQASLSGLDIDTRSDIYSLGVLLYEVLVGVPPLDNRTLLSKGYDEIRRIIREEDAPRPSTRLNTLQGDERTKTAKHRGAELQKLASLLRGDLDWIVMKALEKDRSRRYETANGLATDIQRFLENEPVTAVAPSQVYRLKKFARRNRGTLVTVGAFATVLLLTSAISIWQAFRANTANELLGEQLLQTHQARIQSEVNEQAALVHQLEATEHLQAAWLDRGRELFRNGEPQLGLAWYAWAARSAPTNQVLVDNLVAALTQHAFPRQVSPVMRHQGEVWYVEFSPDGKWLSTASEDNTARIWNTQTGKPVGDPLQHSDTVAVARFSPNGNYLLTMSADGTARLWDTATAKPLHPAFDHAGRVNAVVFSPDSRVCVTGAEDNAVYVWDTRSGERLASLEGHMKTIYTIDFSPDGRRIATGALDNQVILWDAETYQPVRPALRMKESWIRQVKFSPQGDVLLVRGGGRLQFFDAETLEPLSESVEHHYNTSGRFHPNGTRFASASFMDRFQPGKVFIWDLPSQSQSGYDLRHPTHPIRSVDYSPDGERLLTSGYDSTARIWNPWTGYQFEPTFHHPSALQRASFSPDGIYFATAGTDQTARIWDARILTPAIQGLDPTSELVSLEFHPDGERLITAAEDSVIDFWNYKTELRRTLRITTEKTSRAARLGDMSPDGNQLAIHYGRGEVGIWDANSGKLTTPIAQQTAPLLVATFNPNGTQLATGGADNLLFIRDAQTLEPLFEPIRHDGHVLFAVYNSSGTCLATRSRNNSIYLINPQTGEIIGNQIRNPGNVEICFSHDGAKLFTVCMDGKLRTFDTTDGELMTQPLDCGTNGGRPSLSPDGTLFAVPTYDNGVQFFDARNLQPDGDSLRHHAFVKQVRFTPDGKRLITHMDTARGAIQVWDVASRLPIGPPFNNDVYTGFIKPSPDSQFLITRKDRRNFIYELANSSSPAPAKLFELAEAIAGRRILSPAGDTQQISFEQRQTLERELKANSGTSEHDRLMRWLVADRTERTMTPSSRITHRNYEEFVLSQGTENSIKSLLLSSPTNGLAFARLSILSLQRDSLPNEQKLKRARHYHELAQRWAPSEYDTFIATASLEQFRGNLIRALNQIEIAIPLERENTTAWDLKVQVQVALDRYPEAEVASEQLDRLAQSKEVTTRIRWLRRTRQIQRELNHEEAAQRTLNQILRLQGIPDRMSDLTKQHLDLSPFYTHALEQATSAESTANLGAFREVRNTLLGGTRFDARGRLHLQRGETKESPATDSVRIPIGQKFKSIHFLHAADGEDRTSAVGTQLGRYVLHFADGSNHEFSVESGTHLRDWQYSGKNPDNAADNKRLGEVWSGADPAKAQVLDPMKIGLFKTTWHNPHPSERVEHIELISTHPTMTTIVVGITLESL